MTRDEMICRAAATCSPSTPCLGKPHRQAGSCAIWCAAEKQITSDFHFSSGGKTIARTKDVTVKLEMDQHADVPVGSTLRTGLYGQITYEIVRVRKNRWYHRLWSWITGRPLGIVCKARRVRP